MALEKRWEAVSQALTLDGSAQGYITVADASGFFAKQSVTLSSNTQKRNLEVKRVYPTQIWLGEIGTGIDRYADLSAFTVADSAVITANEQVKPSIKPEDILQAVYQRDPAAALRNLLVDKFGNAYDSVIGIDGKRRLAVDAAVSVSGISVDLDALTPSTKPDPDNVLIAGSEDGLKTGTKFAFVNNIRLQILAAKDRVQAITYADFGTKNQRVTQIDYTAASIGTGAGYTARKTLTYTLVGNNYRRDNIIWTLV